MKKDLIKDESSEVNPSFTIIFSIFIVMLVGILIIALMTSEMNRQIEYENYKVACQRIADDNIPIMWTPDGVSPCDVDFDRDGFEEGVVGINYVCYKFGSDWTKYCDNNFVLLNATPVN